MQKKERILVFSTGLVLLLIFTFTDLQISMLLFTQNLYGRIFEIVGELPFMFLAVFGCCLLLRFRCKKNLAVNIIGGACFACFALLFTLMGGFMTLNYLRENLGAVPGFVGGVVGALLLGFALFFALQIPPESAHKAVTYGIIALVYFVLILVVMNTIKTMWGRMRMREMTDPLTQFTPWYIITNRGGFDNRYASFPSGHSMNSAAIVLALLLPSFVPALAEKGKTIKIIAYTWMLLVGASRVVMGAHFASDVTVGILLSLALFELTRIVISKLRHEDLLNTAVPVSGRSK
ncbi:MAG: phosphatase PAP2 family protein [Ruthenibacterium sp.]